MVNQSFSPTLPTLQFAWDSTSLGLLMECPRKYQLSMCATPDGGYAPRMESVHLKFGQLYHGACERYDHAKFAGADHEEALDIALQYCLTETWANGKPWNSDNKNKNRFTLIRTVVWYLDQFRDDPIRTVRLANGKPAVELSFRLETDFVASTGETFLLCGHLDRVGLLNDEAYILDRKTTATTITPDFFEKYNPDHQFQQYSFAAKVLYGLDVKGLIVDAAQIAVTFSRFMRGAVTFSNDQLEEWYGDVGFWLRLADQFAHDNYWPMNRKSCGNYGGCPFREVCAKAPAVRQKWLDASYVKRVWDPMQVRGDI